jgi:VTC domain
MRYEYKYLIDYEQLSRIRSLMQHYVQHDSYAAKFGGQYTVRSIYLDSPKMHMYHTKQDGLPHRLKVRLRGYNIGDDSSQVFLELKKKYQGPILKNRGQLTFGEFKDCLRGGFLPDNIDELPRSEDIRRFFFQVYSQNLRPIVNVVYEREAFKPNHNNPLNDFRLTIDKNLRGAAWPRIEELYQEDGLRYALPNFAILELKFNQFLPHWIKPVVSKLQINKEPASKYVICIDALQDRINTARPSELLLKGGFFRD